MQNLTGSWVSQHTKFTHLSLLHYLQRFEINLKHKIDCISFLFNKAAATREEAVSFTPDLFMILQ